MAKRTKPYTPQELEDSLDIFQDESDRACAIVGAAHLEFLLELAIKSKTVDDSDLRKKLFKGTYAPLGTLSSKIDIAYALNLINKKTHQELHIIRDIRNAFAHMLRVNNFVSDESVSAKCINLHRAVAYTNKLGEAHKEVMLQPRNLFVYSVILISDDLKVIAGILKEKPKRVLMYKSVASTLPGNHFYTVSERERKQAEERFGYDDEGTECFVFTSKVSGTVPLYRLYNHSRGDHFYTISDKQRDSAESKLNYEFEGVECFVFKEERGQSAPLHRLFNPANGDHFYTISEEERDRAQSKFGYLDEGTECFVFPIEQEDTVPLFRLLRVK